MLYALIGNATIIFAISASTMSAVSLSSILLIPLIMSDTTYVVFVSHAPPVAVDNVKPPTTAAIMS